MTLRFGNGMHKVGATRGRPPGSNVRVLQVPEIALAPPAAWDDPEVLDAAALLADFEIVPRGDSDGTVDPDSPTTDAEEGDDDAAEDSEE